jgi:predicted phosphoribosyltransferase
MMLFKDRAQAGRLLAAQLKKYQNDQQVVALGLARGGVVTAVAVAQELKIPVDVMVVRKLGAPGQEELALGALAEDGTTVLNQQLVTLSGIDKNYIDAVIAKERAECARRVALYRAAYQAISLKGKTVLLIDDGIATGMTMEAAVTMARNKQTRTVVVCVPILPAELVSNLKKIADDVVFLEAPEAFMSVGAFYDDFTQVEHEQVIALLQGHTQKRG